MKSITVSFGNMDEFIEAQKKMDDDTVLIIFFDKPEEASNGTTEESCDQPCSGYEKIL